MSSFISHIAGQTVRCVALGLTLALRACATAPTDPAARAEFEKTNDPLEPLNREVFDLNLFVDRVLIKPVAQGYVAVVPEAGRNAIRHFLDNLREPLVFANNMLQGEWKRAHDTFARFLMNSTFGIGGVMDVATHAGLEKQSGDFGQTLYSWGVPDGPYLVLPIAGPSNPRDAVGGAVDGFASPYNYVASGAAVDAANWGRRAINGIDERARNLDTVDELQRNAIDFYAVMRSVSRQRRAQQLRHGEPAPILDLDSLDTDLTQTAQAPRPAQRP